MSRRNGDAAFGKALDLWQPPIGAGEPLVCVATSFTFDATFFETECIGRFLAMDNHPSESESVGYLIEREEKLAAARVCALIDRRHAREKESLRWDVLGVLVPRAIQHSKVSLLAWANHVRVIIGSGNLTLPGYRKNLEVFGAIELSKNDGGSRTTVNNTLTFLDTVVNLAVGDAGEETPKKRTTDALAAVRRQIARWPDTSDDAPSTVFGLPGSSIIAKLSELWPSNGPIRSASVVSPFFDRASRQKDAINGLIGLMAKKRPREISIDVRADDLPDGKTRVYAPLEMVKVAGASCDTSVHRVLPEQHDELRDLHAKMLRLSNESWSMLLAGSSNFTAAGLGVDADHCNLEANLLYRVKASTNTHRHLDKIWPDVSDYELDPDAESLIWDPEPEEMEGGSDTPPLPGAFKEAIFVPGSDARLKITLADPLPTIWSIYSPNESELLGSGRKTSAGQHVVPWGGQPVPFVLQVAWSNSEGQTCAASWPVNVSNPGALPPPDSLRDLTLEELLDILSSSRPLPQAVVDVLTRRTKGGARDTLLDPLKRLDSQAFLLRRTKRVSLALERLRERLERPALTHDAYEWRLKGAIGPAQLADAFVKEASLPGEAKFYLAELALMLSRVIPQRPAVGGLAAAEISTLIAESITEIKGRADLLNVPEQTMSPLDDYAVAAFVEAVAK